MPDNAQFRPGEQHPREWVDDLNPDRMAGQNVGVAGPGPNSDYMRAATAYDVKDVHRRLSEMDDDLLRQIPILPRGARLEQGAVYIDLKDESWSEFKARGDMEAGPDNWYVPKSEVDYIIWNRLIGVTNEERLGLASER